MAEAEMKNILCIGAGYVGGPTMAVIAKHCPEYRVELVDVNAERIAAWQTDRLPIFEPGLFETIQLVRGRNLFFYTDVEDRIDRADILFVSVNTPTKTFGQGAGRAADLQYWEQTARLIARRSTRPKIVVEKSTLPVRTAEAMEAILSGSPSRASGSSDGGRVHFEVVSNPEFLAEGSALRDLENPDRVLIGAHSTPTGRQAQQDLVDIYAHWVPRERILTTDLWSSELAKLAANAMLAQRVSSINAVAALCERTGANIAEVSRAVGMDHRIGAEFLRAGLGFGGSCFRKDILHLAYLCESSGLPEAARYWEEVLRMNEYQKERFVKTMVRMMFNTLAGKRIAVLGFAFKPGTSDTRDSPALAVCKLLLDERARLAISDPRALDSAREDLKGRAECSFTSDPYEAARGAHAIALLTAWPEYRELDFRRIFDAMEKPAFLFDGWNFLDHAALEKIGFHLYRVGAAAAD
jgi:UDPglucose 6-dehydrogenase